MPPLKRTVPLLLSGSVYCLAGPPEYDIWSDVPVESLSWTTPLPPVLAIVAVAQKPTRPLGPTFTVTLGPPRSWGDVEDVVSGPGIVCDCDAAPAGPVSPLRP